MPKIDILCVMLLLHGSLLTQSVYIVIHGTWGADTTWYVPGGDFFDALEKSTSECDAVVVPFCWSGSNSNEARERAAQNLAKLIETYDKTTDIIIVAHSHGGTVALLASYLLKKNIIKILYTLGMPINRFLYPNMDTIEYCYNLFSFEDLVQTVFGMFGREHSPHDRIGNVRVVINGKEPDHSQLHHAVIGACLPKLHASIINSEIKTEPGVIYCNNTDSFIYEKDQKRKDLLERDYRLTLLMLHSLRKSFEMGSKIPLINR